MKENRLTDLFVAQLRHLEDPSYDDLTSAKTCLRNAVYARAEGRPKLSLDREAFKSVKFVQMHDTRNTVKAVTRSVKCLNDTPTVIDLADKWANREHLKAALQAHLEDALRELVYDHDDHGNSSIEDRNKLPDFDKEIIDLAIITQAFVKRFPSYIDVRERVEKFAMTANLPRLKHDVKKNPFNTNVCKNKFFEEDKLCQTN